MQLQEQPAVLYGPARADPADVQRKPKAVTITSYEPHFDHGSLSSKASVSAGVKHSDTCMTWTAHCKQAPA